MSEARNPHRDIELAREAIRIAVITMLDTCRTDKKRQRFLFCLEGLSHNLQVMAHGRRNVYHIRDGGRPMEEDRRTSHEQAYDLSREIAAALLQDIANQALAKRGGYGR